LAPLLPLSGQRRVGERASHQGSHRTLTQVTLLPNLGAPPWRHDPPTSPSRHHVRHEEAVASDVALTGGGDGGRCRQRGRWRHSHQPDPHRLVGQDHRLERRRRGDRQRGGVVDDLHDRGWWCSESVEAVGAAGAELERLVIEFVLEVVEQFLEQFLGSGSRRPSAIVHLWELTPWAPRLLSSGSVDSPRWGRTAT